MNNASLVGVSAILIMRYQLLYQVLFQHVLNELKGLGRLSYSVVDNENNMTLLSRCPGEVGKT